MNLLTVDPYHLDRDDLIEGFMILQGFATMFKVDANPDVIDYCAERKMTPAEATYFRTLHVRLGVLVTKEQLYYLAYGDRLEGDQPEPKIVNVTICKLRKKLDDRYQIVTVWGRGYVLEEAQ